MARPSPPLELIETFDERFVPDHELAEWITATFIEEDGPLYNPDHAHLQFASIEALWTNTDNTRNMRTVIGQAEIMPPLAMGRWQRARAIQQIEEWFDHVPDFLLTFHAGAALSMDDVSFCALVEHELYHCGQKRNADGSLKFTQSGRPSFGIRGHDVEEFVGVVRRYGATEGVAALVQAAQDRPAVRIGEIASACGTCLRAVA